MGEENEVKPLTEADKIRKEWQDTVDKLEKDIQLHKDTVRSINVAKEIQDVVLRLAKEKLK